MSVPIHRFISSDVGTLRLWPGPLIRLGLRFFARTPIRLRSLSRLHGWNRISLLENALHPTIAVTKEVTTLINVFTVEPENQPRLLELLRQNTDDVITKLDGWRSTSIIAAANPRKVMIYSQWRDLAAIEAMRTHPEMTAYFPRISAIATIESMAGDVVYSHEA